MKTATITLHCTDNAGSTLQAFALQYFLRSAGIENEIIDYRPAYLQKYGNPLKRFLRDVLFFRDVRGQRRKREAFEEKYLSRTACAYRTLRELETDPPAADIFIAGSDQIWNPAYACGRDDAYYLRFAPPGAAKAAYAASIGKYPVRPEEIEYVSNRVRDFDYVSVREATSRDSLEKAGVPSVDYVCDPVFLPDPAVYRGMMSGITKGRGRYAVVYLVKPSKLLGRLVERVKVERDCKVILIYGAATNCACDEHVRGIDAADFLAFLHDAEYVIASSFHATAFAHVFHKDFAVVLPEKNTARIEQLLEMSGLSERIVHAEEDIVRVMRHVDYGEAGPRVDDFVARSKDRFLHGLSAACEIRLRSERIS